MAKSTLGTKRHIAFVRRTADIAYVEIFEHDGGHVGTQVAGYETANRGALSSARKEMARIEG